MPNLSVEALQQLRQQVDQALMAPAAPAPEAAQAPTNFCTVWPSAKPILQAVSGVVAFIPGLGKTAAAVLAALLTLGDQIFNSTCHN
jgi:hypothetical protein